MHLDERQVLDVSRELWTSQLGLQLVHRPDAAATDRERVWSSCVRASGPWYGAIVVECPESIGRHAAAMLLSADGQAATDGEIQDAVNELAEMIGSKLRAILPQSTKLSRPTSIDGPAAGSMLLEGMRGQSDLTLHCEGRPVRIQVFEGQPDLAAAS
jgi:chemotaxis protein CheX